MRSFKQFLLEEDRMIPNFAVSFNVTPDDAHSFGYLSAGGNRPATAMLESISLGVKTDFDREDIEIDFNEQNDLTFYIPLRTTSETSEDRLRDWRLGLKSFLQDLLGRSQKIDIQDHFILVREAIPTGWKLKYDDVVFYLAHSKIMSLKGIYKQIECKDLGFYGANKIDSHALGILMIKGIECVRLFDHNSLGCEWLKIIKRCVEENLDIMDCQEQLFDAGYKEYAQL